MLEEKWPGHSSCSGCQNKFCSAEAPVYLYVIACRAQWLLYECRGAGTASTWAGACCYPCCQKGWWLSSVGARNSLERIRELYPKLAYY